MKSMKFKFKNTNIPLHFTFVLMLVLTFVILLVTEVCLSTWYRNHARQNQEGYFAGIGLQMHPSASSVSLSKSENEGLPWHNHPALDAVWQEVNGSRYKFYAYSAYLDTRSKEHWVVRIIAATRTKSREKVACTFYYSSGREFINAKIVAISENWSLPYSAVFIICNLRNFTSIPISTSVCIKDDTGSGCPYTPASNHILISNRNTSNLSGRRNENKIAVCVKPLHNNFDKSIKLIEFIELNLLLGISHFTFYNASIGAGTNCILQEYAKEKIVSVNTWKLNIKSKTEIRTEGMFAALNDCLYRNMYIYPYIAFIDIDEFIVPRFNLTLIDLIRWLSTRYNTRNVSSFSFQNAFFYLQWPDDSSVKLENAVEKNLITLRKSRRKTNLNAHKQRSKFIVKPVDVVEVGNHFVWQFFNNHNTLNVPSTIAILNHYRVCEFGGNDCLRLISTIDRTLHRYRKSLTCYVTERWSRVRSKCDLPSINSPGLLSRKQ